LTDAMTAPSTVSALLHSATMVTAGIFLLLRFGTVLFNFLFNQSLCVIYTALTILLGIVAIIKSAMKKIIAFSTASQLG